MDPVDFLVLGAASAGLTALLGLRHRRPAGAGANQRPGAQLAAVGMAVGHATGRMAAVSGRAVGTGIEVAVAATVWPAGLLLDGALGVVDLAGTTVAALSRSGRTGDQVATDGSGAVAGV